MTAIPPALRSQSETAGLHTMLLVRFAAGLRRLVGTCQAYRKRRIRFRHLARLDDHLLRDIGLEREDVAEAPQFVTGYEGLEIEKRRR